MIGFIAFLCFFSLIGVLAFLFLHLEKSQRISVQDTSTYVKESNGRHEIYQFPCDHDVSTTYHDGIPVVPQYCATLNHLGVLSDRCFPITSSGAFLFSYQDKIDFFQKEVYRKCQRLNIHYLSWFKKKNYVCGTTAILGWIHQSNYYHWMTEVIGKLALLNASGCHYDKVLISIKRGHTLKPFEIETLEAFGLNIEEDVILAQRPCRYLLEKGVIIPPPQNIRGTPSLWYVHYLKQTILGETKLSKQKRKIYISRNDSTRKIVNEKALMKKLTPLGFECISLSGLSVEEQARLFHEASVIISSHGAGLTNLMFSSLGSKLIEIMPPVNVMMRFAKPHSFKNIAHALSIKYQCLHAKSLDEKSMQADLEVNIEELVSAISEKVEENIPALV